MGAGGVRGARGNVGVGMIKGKNIVSTHSLAHCGGSRYLTSQSA